MKHIPPEIVESTPEWTQRIEAFQREHASDALGTVASQVIYEDERVRIWEMTLEPGEASALHHHEHDYYLAILSGDLIAGVGREDFTVFRIPPAGNTVGVTHGGTEWAFNIGTQTYREVLFELKGTGAAEDDSSA